MIEMDDCDIFLCLILGNDKSQVGLVIFVD